MYSLYWSMTTFATVGYGDLHPVNAQEAAFTALYMFLASPAADADPMHTTPLAQSHVISFCMCRM